MDDSGTVESSTGLLPEQYSKRPAWGNKLQYILAQVGFSVGLGNVWRFPYLCHQNGGGAFLLLYFILLLIIGIPLFFLELAAGQSIRQGSIGVWKHINPRLAGIGFASCVVCSYVSLYYNVIIGWSLFYLGNSFQYPLPWESCPFLPNQTTEVVPECAMSSSTTYFWYRTALNITDAIEENGGMNTNMIICLFVAWLIVCLAMIKGIKSSGKVMYFSSVFPYIVLFCFLVRGLTLEGSLDGVRYMFIPKLEIWSDIRVWRQAATQVFFALGLGFGSVIAYSSYNSRNNNCHFDAYLVSCINFFTSVLATLVVFLVLGFKANVIAKYCVEMNWTHIHSLISNGSISIDLQDVNISELSVAEYNKWYQLMNESIKDHGITDCNLEDEMKKGVEGTGLAFIAFTEAMSHFPASPFWSVLFFLMLLNLGLSTMFGNMQGIITPLFDNFKFLQRRKTIFTVVCCIFGFVIGLMFAQRTGNYFVTMFDDYSATLPLIIVVVFEAIAVAWIYGTDRFMDDIEDMLGQRPCFLYKYMWKYVCILAMIGLLLASLVRMCLDGFHYKSWSMEKAEEVTRAYPPLAVALLLGLIALAFFPIPVIFFKRLIQEKLETRDAGIYAQCNTRDESAVQMEDVTTDGDTGLKADGYSLVGADACDEEEENRILLLKEDHCCEEKDNIVNATNSDDTTVT